MAEGFDPYYKWLGIPPKDQPPHHYRLLGIEVFEDDRDVIDAAANRVMSYLKDMSTGDDAAHSQTLLNEISRARICLLNADKKTAYDEQLRQDLKAAGLLDTQSKKPAAKKPPPKRPKPSGPPPAKPPTDLVPPPGVTPPPPLTPRKPFPSLEPRPASAVPSEAVNIVVARQEEPRKADSEQKPSDSETDRDQKPRRGSHRRLGILAGLLGLSVIVFVASLVISGSHDGPGSGKGSRQGTAGKLDPGFQSTAVDGFTSGYGRIVGHWKFDGDVKDDSGSDIRATLVGNPRFVNGRAGRALHLTDGQRFEVANPLFAESSEFSLSFWIKLDHKPDTRRPILDGGELALYLEQGFPKLRVRRLEPDAGQNTDELTNGFNGIDTSKHLHQWIHLGLVYSAPAQQVHYYLNGKHQGSQRYAEFASAEISRLEIGHATADIDDLRIFDYRLNSVAVQAIFDGDFQPLLAAPAGPNGKVACETWHDVPADLTRRQIERVTMDAADATGTLSKGLWDLLPPARGNCLNRIRGFLYPPQDGEYVFLLRSSGRAMFYLQRFQPNEDSLVQIVVNDTTNTQSVPIVLEQDRAYYFEVIHQYDDTRQGLCHVSLGCKPANAAKRRPFAPRDPRNRQHAIPAEYLASYGDID